MYQVKIISRYFMIIHIREKLFLNSLPGCICYKGPFSHIGLHICTCTYFFTCCGFTPALLPNVFALVTACKNKIEKKD